jgi:hypothetical protein
MDIGVRPELHVSGDGDDVILTSPSMVAEPSTATTAPLTTHRARHAPIHRPDTRIGSAPRAFDRRGLALPAVRLEPPRELRGGAGGPVAPNSSARRVGGSRYDSSMTASASAPSRCRSSDR